MREYNAGPQDIPIINQSEQNELQFNMKIEPSGPYVLVIEYVTPINRTGLEINATSSSPSSGAYNLSSKGIIIIRFQSGDDSESFALANLNDCPYTSPCRQVVIDDLSRINTFHVQDANNVIYIDVSKLI